VPMIDIAYVPTMCNHCDDGALRRKGRRRDHEARGPIVLIDPTRPRDAGPRGRLSLRPNILVERRARAFRSFWPFDAHLLDQGWQQTRGHQSCPTGAMRAVHVEDDEMARMTRDEGSK